MYERKKTCHCSECLAECSREVEIYGKEINTVEASSDKAYPAVSNGGFTLDDIGPSQS